MVQASSVAPPPVLKTEVLLAGFWLRVAALLIDFVLLLAVAFVVAMVAITLAPSATWFETGLNAGRITAVIAWAYFALMESSPARGTVGKLAFGLYVSDAHGDPITFWRASARYWLKYVSQYLLGLGYVLAAFTPRKQALHDLLAGTLVLRKVNYFVLGEEKPTEPGDYWDGARWVASVPPMERS